MRWLVVAAALLLVACGDDDAATTTQRATTQPATTRPATTRPPTAAPAQASTSAPTTAPAPATVMSVATTATASASTTAVLDAVVPQGFEPVAATVTTGDGTVCELCLWLAANGDQRALGLMYVTELGGPDGMVFRYDSPTAAAFWMKNTIMPLSIAFYDQDGVYLDAFDMAPCAADPCPSYPTPADFVDAIEVPQGMLDGLGMTPGSMLAVSDLPCD